MTSSPQGAPLAPDPAAQDPFPWRPAYRAITGKATWWAVGAFLCVVGEVGNVALLSWLASRNGSPAYSGGYSLISGGVICAIAGAGALKVRNELKSGEEPTTRWPMIITIIALIRALFGGPLTWIGGVLMLVFMILTLNAVNAVDPMQRARVAPPQPVPTYPYAPPPGYAGGGQGWAQPQQAPYQPPHGGPGSQPGPSWSGPYAQPSGPQAGAGYHSQGPTSVTPQPPPSDETFWQRPGGGS